MSPEDVFEFTVFGTPEPRGSKTPYVLYKDRATKEPYRREDGSIVVNMTDDNAESKAWMELVALTCRRAWGARAPIADAAFEVTLVFFLERPGTSHYGSGRNARLVKDSAPAYPAVLPDLDKLGRGTLDAMTGIVWKGDQQIVGLSMDKRYAVPKSERDNGQGVTVRVQLSRKQRASELPLELRERWLPPGEAEPPPGQDTLLAV